MTLGHANLGVTSIYLQGIDSGEIVEAIHTRRAPTVSAGSLLDAGPAAHDVFQTKLGDVRPPVGA
jgi:hypothetical protein